MDADLSTAFALLFTGMITVFVVLFLVVVSGNVMIRLVNTFAPKVYAEPVDQIDKKKVVAISAAVEIFTQGKGKVTKIEPKK